MPDSAITAVFPVGRKVKHRVKKGTLPSQGLPGSCTEAFHLNPFGPDVVVTWPQLTAREAGKPSLVFQPRANPKSGALLFSILLPPLFPGRGHCTHRLQLHPAPPPPSLWLSSHPLPSCCQSRTFQSTNLIPPFPASLFKNSLFP